MAKNKENLKSFMELKPKIGLEIHIELKTESKMFCSCKNDPFVETPNLYICPICTGQPGTLPSINKEAIKKVIKLGLALNCKIAKLSFFERKNYFYPDLPKGYQISQYRSPLCQNGLLEINLNEGKKKTIRIRRIHIEEDTGKLYHSEDKNFAYVDFNRAGVPLMELVTEPDFSSSKEVREFTQELQLILRHLNISEADMEKGQMRIEANISISKIDKGKEVLGTKVEVKNLNSFSIVEKAVNYEIQRQLDLIKKGKKITQETRGWDESLKKTVSQRVKEGEKDYRYFPEPDLPYLEISQELINQIKLEIPELPYQMRERLKKEYGLSFKEANILVKDLRLKSFFEKCVSEALEILKEKEGKTYLEEKEKLVLSKTIFNLLTSELLGKIKEKGIRISDSKFKITPENFGELGVILYKKEVSSKIAKIILEKMLSRGGYPSQIIKEEGLSLVKDESLDKVIKRVISENSKAVKDYLSGKEEALQFLIGQVMKATKGKADPKETKERVIKVIK